MSEPLLELSSWLYVTGAGAWVVLWWFAHGFTTMRDARALWFPFLACIAVLMINAALVEGMTEVGDAAREESRFRFLGFRARLAITGLMSVLIVGGVLASISTFSLSREFVRFQMLAVVFFLGFMAPVIWMPTNNPAALVVLRHYQTVPFTYGLFLSIAGIIVLLNDLSESPNIRSIGPRGRGASTGAEGAHDRADGDGPGGR